MAPGRKRGAKGAKTKNDLSLGDLVLAKVKGFPAWPAKISRPEDWERTPDPRKYFVQFFGTEEIAFVAPVDIQIFTVEAKTKLLARCRSKTVKYFAQAVKEICEQFEELQNDKSSGRGDDTDRSAFGSETSSLDRVVDEAAEFDLKEEGIAIDELNGETEIRRLGDNGSGLECCSLRRGEMECQDEPSNLAHSNDHLSPVVSPAKRIKISNYNANLQSKEEVSTPALCKISFAKDEGNSCGEENTSSFAKVSVCAEKHVSVKKQHANGLNSRKGVSGAKRKFDGASEATNKVSISGGLTSPSCDSSSHHINIPESGKDLKDKKIRRKNSVGGSMKESSELVKSKINGNGKKAKQLAKDNLIAIVTSHTAKQARGADLSIKVAKVSLQSNRENDVLENKSEAKRPVALQVKTESRVASKGQSGRSDSNVPGGEDVLRAAKRRRQALESVSSIPISTSKDKITKISTFLKTDLSVPDTTKSLVTKVPPKRRAVRLFDDDEPRTPIHGGSTKYVDAASRLDFSKDNLVKCENSINDLPCERNSAALEDDDEDPRTPIYRGSTKYVDAASRLDFSKDNLVKCENSINDLSCERTSSALEDGPLKECIPSSKPLSDTLSPIPKQNLDKTIQGVVISHASPSPKNIESEQNADRPKKGVICHVFHSPRKIESDQNADRPTKVVVSHVTPSPRKIESEQNQDRPKKGVISRVSPSPRKIELDQNADRPTKVVVSHVTPSPRKIESEQNQGRPKKGVISHVSPSTRKLESEKTYSNKGRPNFISPIRSPVLVSAAKQIVESLKSTVKVSGNVTQKKGQAGSVKFATAVSDGLSHPQSQTMNEKTKPSFLGERPKSTPNLSSRLSDSVHVVAAKLAEANNVLPSERVEPHRDDKMTLLLDSKVADSDMSMKHLIAVAQAKRRQPYNSNDLSHGASDSVIAPGPDISLIPSPVFDAQPIIVSVTSSVNHPNIQASYGRTSLVSTQIHQPSSNNQSMAMEEVVERRVSSGHRPAGGSLSGGTEAAVARDAFEGMIETLSRTKESIGRATRLAIDCAKYGIANEVVELLIRKLESEPSLHRRVDLFFLVDSITQCSHNHKGIAGASYIPTVQAALPRLLGAAAPSGTGARENRRQCLKVLRLWLERKILPEPVLRCCMDNVGVSNDDSSAVPCFRRPSRAERAVDDPIREMEGMLVDEYGSNATFQLPGLLSSHVFEEEEEQEQEQDDDDDDNLPSIPCKEIVERSSLVKPAPSTVEPETCVVTPNDRRHCILEDVDGELEMEDVYGHSKHERPLFLNVSMGVPQQPPPLPHGSPPPTPPLPSSPPPLPPSDLPLPSPPPPLSPPPPTPPLPSQTPPAPLQSRTPPLPFPLQTPPAVPFPTGTTLFFHPQTSLPSQPALASQTLLPPPPPGLPPLSPSPPPLPPPPPLPSQQPPTVPFSTGTALSFHPQTSLPSQPALASQTLLISPPPPPPPPPGPPPLSPSPPPLPPPPTVPFCTGMSLSLHPQPSQPTLVPQTLLPFHSTVPSNSPKMPYQPPIPNENPLIQVNASAPPVNAPLAQRLFHPAPPPQASSSHFSYSKTLLQHHTPHHLYPPPYSLVNQHDGSGGYAHDSQRGVWLNGGRTSCSHPPFPQEGYSRPALERLPPANSATYQPSSVSTYPAGAQISGQGGPMMVPYRPDLSSLNWKPA